MAIMRAARQTVAFVPELPQAPASPSVLLSSLADAVAGADITADVLIRSVSEDSRDVRPGALFFAVRRRRSDWEAHIAAALAGGAGAVVVDRPLSAAVPQLVVPSVREAIGPLCARFYGDPSRRLAVVGVTGTNGKTTTSTLIRHGLEAFGVPAGQIGTVGTCLFGRWSPASLTTPRAPELQHILGQMALSGAAAVSMEVSSHALDQHRVDGTRMTIGVFTNLSGEHLDYHGTMEQYWASKAMLFEPGRCGYGIIGVDDEWGRRLAHQARIPITTFGRRDADITVSVEEQGLRGISVTLAGRGDEVRLWSRLVGKLNAGNVAAAYLALRRLGVPRQSARAGIASCPPPPGRFEVVGGGEPFLVVIDYAHTPDALAGLISTARTLTGPGGKITVVVGARGGRDRFKRPRTGRVAAAADRVLLTTDSPGDEPVGPIIDQLYLGTLEAPGVADVLVEHDRRRAITRAVAEAQRGDVVLVVGRGHEAVQHVAGRAVELDDRQVAHEALAAWRPDPRVDALTYA